jgi:hypothetical protein
VGPKEKEFSKPFSIGQKLIIVLEIVMKIRKKPLKFLEVDWDIWNK